MLRTDEVVALDDVVIAHKRAASTCEDAAGLVAHEPLATVLGELGAEHRRMAGDASRLLGELHELPSEPDPDREALRKLARHARSALEHHDVPSPLRDCERDEDRLSESIATTLALRLRDCERDEDRLSESIATTLALRLPDSFRRLLEAQRTRVAEIQSRLAQERIRHSASPGLGSTRPE